MTVAVHEPSTFEEAIAFLQSLPRLEFAFRGHRQSSYRLCTSFDRFRQRPLEDNDPDLRSMIDRFRDGVRILGLGDIESESLLDWMEYGRHHDLPTPLLDLTRSPYVALFFAYSGLQISDPAKAGKCAVYAISTTRLAFHYAQEQVSDDQVRFAERYHQFLRGAGVEDAVEHLPKNLVRLVPFPSRHTQRMHRQLGLFLYCSNNYDELRATDLEDYLDKLVDPEGSAVCHKLVLDHQWATEVLERLELMNLTAAQLMLSVDGVAVDIRNGYNYHVIAPYLRPSTPTPPSKS